MFHSCQPHRVVAVQAEFGEDMQRRIKRGASVAGAVLSAGALTFGVAAPALAEGHFNSYMGGWYAGTESRQWINLDQDATDDRATFSSCNKNDWRVTIYKEDFGPDTNVGSETLQCTSSADAVRAGDVPRDEYHFTLKDGSNVSANVTVYW